MLEGTIEHDGAVFGIHCHIVPTTDPDVRQMIAFRDLLRADHGAVAVRRTRQWIASTLIRRGWIRATTRVSADRRSFGYTKP
jgi:GrpB-like predicted nucleotidyltransferase (UPF0157 family)